VIKSTSLKVFCIVVVHRMTHFLARLAAGCGINTALFVAVSAKHDQYHKDTRFSNLIASSKTFFRPFCVSAEHSRYLSGWLKNVTLFFARWNPT